MYIEWEDPYMRLHGKRHKNDSFYFRWHYGKQRMVQIYKEYVDKPTEGQKSAREAFTELRREVARQLRDAELRERWMQRFEEDSEGYKMLHTYVYAQLKAGVTVTQSPTCRDALLRVSPNVPQEHNQHTSNDLPILDNKGDAQKGVSTSCVGSELGKSSTGDAINGVSTPCAGSGLGKSSTGDAIGVSTSCVGSELGKSSTETRIKGVSTGRTVQDMQPIFLLYNHTITPLFLPWKVPKRECLQI